MKSLLLSGRAHEGDVRLLVEMVVHRLERAFSEIGQHLFHAALGLAQKNRAVRHALFRVQHGGNAAEHDPDPALPVLVGNGPAPLHLHGQHHADAHKIRGRVKVDGLQILVDKGNIHIVGQGCGKDHRAVRRQVEFGLAAQFVPLGVNQGETHAIADPGAGRR